MNTLRQEIETQLKAGNSVAAGLFAIAAELQTLAVHLKYLGVGDAATTMGAIEYLAVSLSEKIGEVGTVISEAIERIEK